MTVSMRVMSFGGGYRYLLDSVVASDVPRGLTEPLVRYYQQAGTPPGIWHGSGVGGFQSSAIFAGAVVTEGQLRLLLGKACHPITGEPLGRRLPRPKSLEERIEKRVASLPLSLTLDEQAEATSAIEEEEQARTMRHPVVGFDHTFSVPKSVSTLWAVADGGTQALIARAHRAAFSEVLDLLERDVAMTRVGADAGDGSVAQVEVRGVIATAYDHFDSRAADPQLHTHVVIANRVQGVHDGKWRTLDGRPIHRAVVALSEHYNAVLADHLTRDLGVEWEWRDRGPRRNQAFEIVGVPDALLAEFSSRSHDIELRADELIAEFTEKHGRPTTQQTLIRLRAAATLMTRPDKQKRSLAELTEQWRARADEILGADSTEWATNLLKGAEPVRVPLLRASDASLELLEEIGGSVVEQVGNKRTTWRKWNLYAEAARQLMDIRFASTEDREAVTGLVVDAAERASLRLTPGELAHSPVVFQRSDGTSVFRPKDAALFSSAEMLAAEDRLLALAATDDAPKADVRRVDRAIARKTDAGHLLGEDQARAVAQVALSGRAVDVMLGPAGTGKTTSLLALRKAWESEFGPGSVVGLATSAPAAEVLGQELGIKTENTAKWEYEHRNGRWDFKSGQLILVDESSMAGTYFLDRLMAHARSVGAKVVLVGDPAQLDAVDPSGVFGLIARNLGGDAPQLNAVHRFEHKWERSASLALRLGDESSIDTYKKEQRLTAGESEAMLDAVYSAWLTDIHAGLTSLMITETIEATIALNQRARLDRIIASTVDATRSLKLHDGTEASRGDLVITRRNNRRLRPDRRSWVKNGDIWNVIEAHSDGSLTVQRTHSKGKAIRLPANYVTEHVELAYAITAHRAQGATVDTGHVVVHSNQMTREAFYVAMTRGRQSNHAYVAIDQAQLEEHQARPDEEVTLESVLAGVLRHSGTELSAHEAIEAEQEKWSSIAQLAAEYDTIAQVAQQDRWVGVLEASGLPTEQIDQIVEGDSFGALAAELRRAAANGHRPETLVPQVLAGRPITHATDIGAVLRHRIQQATTARTGSTQSRAPQLIAGLFPKATGVSDPDLRRALREREQLIEGRARALAQAALDEHHPWIAELGAPPTGRRRTAWERNAATVAAYRDRYRVTSGKTFLGKITGTVQRIDAARARAALNRAAALAERAPSRRRSAPDRAAPLRL
ncbi:conjugal transfer protein [Leucobacter sp. UCD-THU]|uniref:MobF family relaxase n=1 Tax=Leucobacter sp. UCD-THU TaxID=1292023 RepID=UPI0003A6BDDA|nr:MobF family relaxase [Leucobacter sp. UCD-THU]EYT56604.1 conjugal transfer protein [Leucobacter sp. UCD-THU]